MTDKPKKDHIEQAILEAQRQDPSSLKATVADRVLTILNEHTGVDLKKSEAQSYSKDLIKLQTDLADHQHEKQDQ